ncbi:DUF962 domain-containing protein [Hylemonella sp. W303a]|uniref:Mpo1 family 2-hydroxy fatty acid dioxygenase n=1 Tax=Hylemonella sp. W303a TaxID=3389873 RepID=UPI00396AF651
MTTLAQDNHDGATRRVDQLLAHYGASHRNPANELIHYAAIPLIMLSIVGLIFAIHPLAAYAFIGASLIYYIRLSRMFTLAMAAISALGLALVHLMGDYRVAICASIFVVAWIFQFIGHRIEGKKPSFFEDVQYLWVGPLFVLSHLFLKRGLRW